LPATDTCLERRDDRAVLEIDYQIVDEESIGRDLPALPLRR
jgi:hypothetical protein